MSKLILVFLFFLSIPCFGKLKIVKQDSKDGPTITKNYYQFSKIDREIISKFLVGRKFDITEGSTVAQIKYISNTKLLVCKYENGCNFYNKSDWQKLYPRRWGFKYDRQKKYYRLYMNDKYKKGLYEAKVFPIAISYNSKNKIDGIRTGGLNWEYIKNRSGYYPIVSNNLQYVGNSFLAYEAYLNKDYTKAVSYYAIALKSNPPAKDLGKIYYQYGNALWFTDQQKAIDAYIKAAENNYKKNYAYYNAACLYSKKNDPDNSLVYLKKAVQNGYTNFNHILRDSDLRNLRRAKKITKAYLEGLR